MHGWLVCWMDGCVGFLRTRWYKWMVGWVNAWSGEVFVGRLLD